MEDQRGRGRERGEIGREKKEKSSGQECARASKEGTGLRNEFGRGGKVRG